MKNQQHVKGDANVQGNTTSDRNFSDLKGVNQQRGVSNGGGQRSDQTSNQGNSTKYVKSTRRRML